MANSTRLLPKLSIGLPVYNGEKFLPQALECLLVQTFGDFEIIISDNASTDRTQQICHDYMLRDTRIRYVRNDQNLGAAANCNRVFELSSAPLFKWAAHDDLHRETHLESCVQLLFDNQDVVLAHSATTFIDEYGQPFPFDNDAGDYLDPRTGVRRKADSPEVGNRKRAVERFWQVLIGARWGTHAFGVIRRQALQQTRLLPNFASNDRPLLAELALLGRFQSSPKQLFLRRLYPNGSWTMSKEELKAYLCTDGKAYSRRVRQIEAYFSAPKGKPIGTLDKLACTMMVAAHCVRIGAQALTRKEARIAAQRSVWRVRADVQSSEVLK